MCMVAMMQSIVLLLVGFVLLIKGAFNIWRGKKASFLYDRWGSVKCLS